MNLLFVVFLGAFIIQLFFYLYFFGKLAIHHSSKGDTADLPEISVIICAKDESKNLKGNLPGILTQDYPDFEVIVVDDASNDDTPAVLEAFSKEYAHLNFITLSKEESMLPGKKLPLSKGIQLAKNKFVLLTDADCKVTSSLWIKNMSNHFVGNRKVVLGYGPYKKYLGFLNKCIRFETVYTAMKYLSFTLRGLPYMGVGRNLAYGKPLFDRVGGFESHKEVMSGDDDLFINSVANSKNTTIEISPLTFMFSEPKRTWSDWFKQKRRHLTTGLKYKFSHKVLLGILSISHILFYVSFLVLLINFWRLDVVVGLFLIRLIAQIFIYSKVLRKLGEMDLLLLIPLLDFLYLCFYLTFAPTLVIRKSNRWV